MPRAMAARGDQPGPAGAPAARISPEVGASGAGDEAGERGLAVAGDAGEAGDAAAAQGEVDGAQAGRAVGRDGARARGAAGPAGTGGIAGGGDLGADHQAGELVAVGVARSRRSPTRRPWRRTRTRSETAITSRSLWEMKTIERPSRHGEAERAEERLGLLRRQHGGRLVEDEDAGVAVERLQDLDPLALADGEVGDAGVGVDLEAEAARRGRAMRARGVAEAEAPERAGAEHDVLEHGEVVGEGEVLVHHADAGRERGARLAGRERAAHDLDGARVGDVVAEEDVHQRRLAGAVLAEKRDDLALVQGEADAVVGERAAPKRLVMPSRRRTTGAATAVSPRTSARCRRSRP